MLSENLLKTLMELGDLLPEEQAISFVQTLIHLIQLLTAQGLSSEEALPQIIETIIETMLEKAPAFAK